MASPGQQNVGGNNNKNTNSSAKERFSEVRNVESIN